LSDIANDHQQPHSPALPTHDLPPCISALFIVAFYHNHFIMTTRLLLLALPAFAVALLAVQLTERIQTNKQLLQLQTYKQQKAAHPTGIR
jgi:hypothetical protein